MDVVRIGDRPVGAGAPVYIIAEAGSNHDRDLDQARRLIDVAADAGADAVKFQTFRADAIVAETPTRAKYLDEILPPGQTMSDLFRQLELPREWHATLAQHAADRGIDFLSTPFDHEAVDLLDGLGVKAFKVATYELWHLPLIRDIASRGRPIICSTGMADMAAVQAAVDVVRQTGNEGLILLHCVVNYPPPFADLNLRAIETMRRAFGVPVGWSDHTPGWLAPVIATSLGAAVIEKHFTTDRSRPGPDHQFALEPDELAEMVRAIRDTEAALGDGVKRRAPAEDDLYVTARRSLFAARAIEAGAVVGPDDVAVLRPGTGLEVADLDKVVGRTARRRIERHEPLAWDMF
ncbi:MAG TPA: N-acetylneuraminate synthase family protein [Candidatus Limnocylindrales bacterium]|jgi:sialic acid synthase SpsE